MPYNGRVALAINCEPQEFELKIRIPRWVEGDVHVLLNGKPATTGCPGTFITLTNRWKQGDQVNFNLPFAWKLSRYEGAEQAAGYDRYAFEYGPLLMAFKSALDGDNHLVIGCKPSELTSLLQEKDTPLHFSLQGQPGIEVVPYLEIKPDMAFTCFPLFAQDPS